MGMRNIRGSFVIAAATALAAALAGCGGSEAPVTVAPGSGGPPSGTSTARATTKGAPTTDAPTTPTGAPTAGTSTSAPSASPSSDQDEILGAIAAGAPPKDLQWIILHVPSSWKRMTDVGAGQAEWSIGQRCIVFVDQPGNIGTQPEPDSRGVLEHTAEQTGQVFPGKPKPTYVAGARTQRTLPNYVKGLHGVTTAKFEQDVADYGKGRSQFLAYRNGNFALTFTGLCATRSGFAAKKKTFEKFIAGLEVRTTY